MHLKTYLLISVVLQIFCQTKLDFDECQKYRNKLEKINPQNQDELLFQVETFYDTLSQKLIVNLRYNDSFYNDEKFWGLIQDGYSDTCLDFKIFKYSNNQYNDPINIEQVFKGSKQKKQRSLSFEINSTELSPRLIKTINNNIDVYNGYFSIVYYEPGNNKVLYKQYFQFYSDAVSNFRQLTSVSPICTLQWCTDATCTVNTVPDLYLNVKFYLQQIVTTTDLSGFFLTGTTVTYVGQGLHKVTAPVSIDNSKPGKVLLLMTADIAWSNLIIEVTSFVSTTQTGTRLLSEVNNTYRLQRRILQTTNATTYDPISGSTQPITCVKITKDAAACPTCAEECTQNGFSREGCPVCNEPGKINTSYGQMVLPFVAIITVFII